jgi:uracil phosphoribosyltransferase
VLADLVARGADASNIRVVAVVAAPPALKQLSEKYPGALCCAPLVALLLRGGDKLRASPSPSRARALPTTRIKTHKKTTLKGLRVYTAIIDAEVDDRGYIIPGLGDAGDRAFGTARE